MFSVVLTKQSFLRCQYSFKFLFYRIWMFNKKKVKQVKKTKKYIYTDLNARINSST